MASASTGPGEPLGWHSEPELEGMPEPDPVIMAARIHAAMTKELRDWWINQAKAEAAEVIPKAIEYSAYDLVLIGRIMLDMMGWDGAEATDAWAAEFGCWFYLIGKMGRAVGAAQEGRLVSDDSLHDISVYCRMIQRIREVGSWPGVQR